MFISQDGGYRMLPGLHTFSNWSASINADGFRNVPDTHSAACSIALVGDSLTFGFGVNDADTWVNLLARDFPNVYILNAGVTGYNANQVLTTIEQVRAAGYFYLMIWNDAEPPLAIDSRWPDNNISALSLYILWLRAVEPPSDMGAFSDAVRNIEARPDTQIIGFQTEPPGIYAWVAEHYSTPLILLYTHVNSHADSHPNMEGNKEIEVEIKPLFAQFAHRICGNIGG